MVQHLDPHHQSQLSNLLQSHTALPVHDAIDGAPVEPNHVYVIEPNTSVAIADGVLAVTPREEERRPHYPVDYFLRSLAAVQGTRAIGVVLSGTGSDGTLGVCEIKAAGGVAFAQEPTSAQHAGMPQSAIASGAVDLVLRPDQIGGRLAELREHPYLHTSISGEESDVEGEPFHTVITALRSTSGVDFSQYRDTTLKRRTARRMLLRGFSSTGDYAEFIRSDPAEAEALYRDVLINVTSFFRNPGMFENLAREVFPEIVKERTGSAPIRVWVAGCSTGQEAYSIAMALVEFLEASHASHGVQIFATDLGDPAALDRARAGVYPESIEAEVSAERLQRFFTREERGYRVRKELRDLCVFARQNISVDPPFSRVDLSPAATCSSTCRRRCRRVNRLNNAVKFTPPGGHIWLTAAVVADEPDHYDTVQIRVRDTGIGIAAEVLPTIFDMFMQGDRSLERTRGGLGVGLTLVRNMVLLHGGSIEVRSEGIGAGSGFIIHLPIDPAQHAPVGGELTPHAPPGRPLTIVVADDNQDAREMLQIVLESEGHRVTTAADGPSAVACVEELQPDVAILDIGMPGMSGYDVARRVRPSADGAGPVLVALSGMGQDDDKARGREAGFAYHFTKPVDVQSLTSLLARLAHTDQNRLGDV